MSFDEEGFRQALSRFAAGVTIVTTVDEHGQQWGFTASAFASLSLRPPLVLVCLDSAADSHSAFTDSEAFAVNILKAHHTELATQFASKGADKFAGGHVPVGPAGLPVLPDALAVLECRTHQLLPGGDHTILIGEVLDSAVDDGRPMIYYDRAFRELERAEVSG